MSGSLTDSEFRMLREYIERSCAISLGDEKAYLVENRLVGLLSETGCSTFAELHKKAVTEPSLGLRDRIVNAMTTNETSWFRDQHPFDIMKNTIFKKYADEIASGIRKKIRIWCAACSTGQEPYSLAIALHEFSRKVSVLPLQYTEIIGTDISPSVLFLAIAGRYDQIAISRGLPQEIRDRYFSCNGRLWTISDTIRKMVTFKKLNLQDSFHSFGFFDVVFCRNVMIYFADAFKRDLLSRIAAAMNPGGFLFLGAAESPCAKCDGFSIVNESNHIYYRLAEKTNHENSMR